MTDGCNAVHGGLRHIPPEQVRFPMLQIKQSQPLKGQIRTTKRYNGADTVKMCWKGVHTRCVSGLEVMAGLAPQDLVMRSDHTSRLCRC